MTAIQSIAMILFAAIVFYSSKTFNPSNYQDLKKPDPVVKASIKKEIRYIEGLKERVENWEKQHDNKVLRDGFNTLINDKNRYDPPVKGGFLDIRLAAEPKVLTSYLDNSAVTSMVSSHIYNSLLEQNPETFKLEPSLAKSWELEDVVWLKGKKKGNLFKEKGDNNYLIGKILKDKIQWDKDEKKVIKLSVKVGDQTKVIDGDQLRYKESDDPNDKYRRVYDLGVIFTFHLRKDVRWHDGKAFNADDILFTLDLIKNPYIARMTFLRNYFKSLKAWKKIDNYTVRFYVDTQYFKALENYGGFSILPKHVYIKKGQTFTQKEMVRYFEDHKANKEPIGTGPYYCPSKSLSNRKQEKGWEHNEKLTLVRNDDYFDESHKPYLKKIIFHFLKNPDSAFIALKNGKVNFMPGLTTEQFLENTASKGFKAKYVKTFYYVGGFGYIGYNMKKVYFKDIRVRKAITHLLDRKRILEKVFYGLGKIVTGSQYFFGPAYNHNVKPYLFDRKKAIDLLNEAGWIDSDGDGLRDKDGVPMVIELLYPQASTTARKITPFLFEALQSVGIQLKLTQLEWTVFIEHLRDRKFDMCLLGWGTPIESDPYQIWHSSMWANKGSNHVGFDNKEADRIIVKIRRTLNDQERWKLHHRFHEILHEEQPYLFLFIGPSKGVYNNRFRNVKFYRSRPGYNLTEWYIPKALQTREEIQAEKE